MLGHLMWVLYQFYIHESKDGDDANNNKRSVDGI